MAVKNFWSLNVDEALVADKLQLLLKKKGYEVFFPLRAQLKDIDLLLFNLKTKKTHTIQVKGSRSYIPQKREMERFGDGQAAWFTIDRKKIFEPEYHVDYFILLIHLEKTGKTKREIEAHYLVMPADNFRQDLLKFNKKVRKNGQFDFFIFINPKENKAIEFSEWSNCIDFSKYLNRFDFE